MTSYLNQKRQLDPDAVDADPCRDSKEKCQNIEEDVAISHHCLPFCPSCDVTNPAAEKEKAMTSMVTRNVGAQSCNSTILIKVVGVVKTDMLLYQGFIKLHGAICFCYIILSVFYLINLKVWPLLDVLAFVFREKNFLFKQLLKKLHSWLNLIFLLT